VAEGVLQMIKGQMAAYIEALLIIAKLLLSILMQCTSGLCIRNDDRQYVQVFIVITDFQFRGERWLLYNV